MAKKAAAARQRQGPVEKATASELRRLRVSGGALAAAARALARQVDAADTPSGAASAARELRMTMAAAREAPGIARPRARQVKAAEKKAEAEGRLSRLRRSGAKAAR